MIICEDNTGKDLTEFKERRRGFRRGVFQSISDSIQRLISAIILCIFLRSGERAFIVLKLQCDPNLDYFMSMAAELFKNCLTTSCY